MIDIFLLNAVDCGFDPMSGSNQTITLVFVASLIKRIIKKYEQKIVGSESGVRVEQGDYLWTVVLES